MPCEMQVAEVDSIFSGNKAQFSNPNGIAGFKNSLFVNDLITDES